MRLLLSFLLLCGTLAHAALIDDLTAAQKKQLLSGESVAVSKDDGEVWPKVTIYRLINATPKQMYSLLTDYASAPSYTPGMLEAKVIDSPNASTKDVQYTVKVPVLSKITYSVRNYYAQKGNTYQINWELLKSPVAKKSDGSIQVEPYEGQSILCYSNQVVPSTSLAVVLKGQALEEAKKTVQAIAQEGEKRASSTSQNPSKTE